MHNTAVVGDLSYDLSKCSELSGYTPTEICDIIGVSGTAKLEGTVLTVGPQTSVILK